MNNPVIYWVIGGLLILFFFYLTYRFVATWRIWHVMFAFLVFAASVALPICVSMTVRTHNAWRSLVAKQTQKIADLESDRDKMRYGSLTEVIQTTPSIRSRTAELGRALIDRGRVWRGCTPAQPAADDTVTVSTAAAGAGAEAARPNRIEQNMILYVFVEADAPAEEKLPPGTKVPFKFIGEFAAAAVTDASVTLKPTTPLDAGAKQLLRVPGHTWAIHETMPVDGHRYFASNPNQEPDLNRSADESPVFGQIDEATFHRLVPPPQRQGLPSDEVFKKLQERYAKMIAPYLRDGRRANEGDPPGNVWLKVRFTQPYKEEVDTAGNPLGAVTSSQTFFDRGRAEVSLLRRGKPAQFKKGDVALFPQDDANRLINQERVCELIERVYVRSLNDYETSFRSIARHMARLDKDIRQVTRDTAEATRANEMVVAEIRAREEERDKLKEDLKKTELERDRIRQYAGTLETGWQRMHERLLALYRTNSQLAEQLATLDKQLTAEANRRAAEAIRSEE